MDEFEKYRVQLAEYRTQLIAAEQKAQEEYDKTVLALSGGAFGVSFAFVDNFIGEVPQSTCWLFAAWVVWGASITAVLFSFFFSTKAMRKAIEQVDSNNAHDQPVGGFYSRITSILNITGGSLFFVGAVLLVIFVAQNI